MQCELASWTLALTSEVGKSGLGSPGQSSSHLHGIECNVWKGDLGNLERDVMEFHLQSFNNAFLPFFPNPYSVGVGRAQTPEGPDFQVVDGSPSMAATDFLQLLLPVGTWFLPILGIWAIGVFFPSPVGRESTLYRN